MDDLEFLQQPIQGMAYRVVDEDGADAAADDQKDRFIRSKMAEVQSGQAAAGQKFPSDGRPGQHRLALREIFHGLREVAADF